MILLHPVVLQGKHRLTCTRPLRALSYVPVGCQQNPCQFETCGVGLYDASFTETNVQVLYLANGFFHTNNLCPTLPWEE